MLSKDTNLIPGAENLVRGSTVVKQVESHAVGLIMNTTWRDFDRTIYLRNIHPRTKEFTTKAWIPIQS